MQPPIENSIYYPESGEVYKVSNGKPRHVVSPRALYHPPAYVLYLLTRNPAYKTGFRTGGKTARINDYSRRDVLALTNITPSHVNAREPHVFTPDGSVWHETGQPSFRPPAPDPGAVTAAVRAATRHNFNPATGLFNGRYKSQFRVDGAPALLRAAQVAAYHATGDTRYLLQAFPQYHPQALVARLRDDDLPPFPDNLILPPPPATFTLYNGTWTVRPGKDTFDFL